MRGASLAFPILLLFLLPAADAGTREDPEVVDAAHDGRLFPGMPLTDATVDILGVWFGETDGEIVVSMEVAELPSVPTALGNGSPLHWYVVHVFVDGQDLGKKCAELGDFALHWWSDAPDGQLQQDWEPNHCMADPQPVTVAVADNVIAWMVPKDRLAMLGSGSLLTVERAEATSLASWPLGPGDHADDLPGRAFTVAVGAEQARAPAAGAAPGPEDDGAPQDAPDAAVTSEAEAPLPAAAAMLALASVVAVRRRRPE